MAVPKEQPSFRRKLALIVGNDNYVKPSNKLNYSSKNAKDLSKLLKSINFEVTKLSDCNKKSLTETIIDFGNTVKDGDLVLCYFSGHACQANRINYFMPIDDDKIENDTDIEDFAVNIDRTVSRFADKNPSYLTLFILDCGTPYFLKKSTKSSSAVESAPLSEIRAPAGTFIQYAYAINQVVRDTAQTDRNSLFTKHLLKHITRGNVHFTELFKDISKGVSKESSGKQMPYSIDQFKRGGPVYLNEVVKPPTPPPEPDRFLDDQWNEKKDGNLDVIKKENAQVKAYYDNFPTVADVTNDTKPEIKEAKEFTNSIIKSLPSGNAADRSTACHVLKNVLKAQNIDCLFYDSNHGKDLRDSSSVLAEINLQQRPFVLTLNSCKGLGGRRGPNTENGAIRLIRTISESIEKHLDNPVYDDLVTRLAEAHHTEKKNIYVTNMYVGSFNITYYVKALKSQASESLLELEQNLKDKFKQLYVAVKLHPLLCRPAFDISFFDKQGNKTFSATPETHAVGPPGRTQTYTSPAGWTRYGLKVLGKYTDGNYWLEPFGDSKNWYRAFHGTGRASAADFDSSKQSYEQQFAPVDAMASIYKTGFRKARVHAYGDGVYCSPDPKFPEVGYVGIVACDTEEGRKKFKCMLQVAVNPDGVKFTTDKQIWVVPDPEDIRPYGILIKDA